VTRKVSYNKQTRTKQTKTYMPKVSGSGTIKGIQRYWTCFTLSYARCIFLTQTGIN